MILAGTRHTDPLLVHGMTNLHGGDQDYYDDNVLGLMKLSC